MGETLGGKRTRRKRLIDRERERDERAGKEKINTTKQGDSGLGRPMRQQIFETDMNTRSHTHTHTHTHTYTPKHSLPQPTLSVTTGAFRLNHRNEFELLLLREDNGGRPLFSLPCVAVRCGEQLSIAASRAAMELANVVCEFRVFYLFIYLFICLFVHLFSVVEKRTLILFCFPFFSQKKKKNTHVFQAETLR